MPLKGNPITQNRRLSGTFPVSLEPGPNDGDRKESSIPLSKESFKQLGALQPVRAS